MEITVDEYRKMVMDKLGEAIESASKRCRALHIKFDKDCQFCRMDKAILDELMKEGE